MKPSNKSTLRVLTAAVCQVLTKSHRALRPPETGSRRPNDGADVQFSRRLYRLLNSLTSISNPFSTFAFVLSCSPSAKIAGVWSDPTFRNLRIVAIRQERVEPHLGLRSMSSQRLNKVCFTDCCPRLRDQTDGQKWEDDLTEDK